MRHGPLRSAIDFAVYVAVRLVLCIVQALPIETCLAGTRVLAWLFCDVLRIRRLVVDENLRYAYPRLGPDDRRRLARRMWQHLFLMVVECAHARRKIHFYNWHRYVRLERAAELVRHVIDPRPAVLVTAHYGNFELAGFLLGLFGFPTVTVARKLDNRYLDRFVNEFRGATGQYMVPKEGSSREIEKFLERGANLTLLGDQAAGPKGCWVEFLGRPASTHKAIALFSLGNQGPLLVTFSRRIGKPLHYVTGLAALADPADPGYKLGTIPALTQWFSDELAAVIDVAPEQYWWLHRRWKGAPPARKRSNKREAA
jgi:KDO2-lipid IV(A) lauroyltransferase